MTPIIKIYKGSREIKFKVSKNSCECLVKGTEALLQLRPVKCEIEYEYITHSDGCRTHTEARVIEPLGVEYASKCVYDDFIVFELDGVIHKLPPGRYAATVFLDHNIIAIADVMLFMDTYNVKQVEVK